MCYAIFFLFCELILLIRGQTNNLSSEKFPATFVSDRIGNFSVELVYETWKVRRNENFVVSPFTVWTILAATAKGASGNTNIQLRRSTRLPKNSVIIYRSYQTVLKNLEVNTTTIPFDPVTSLFVDKRIILEKDTQDALLTFYKTPLIPVEFNKTIKTANLINKYVEQVSKGRIKNLVDENSIADAKMILASALYFKGPWAVPFNKSLTERRSFYDANCKKIGEVNMMHNRHTYSFAQIKELKARVLKLPYGVEGRLSMLIMLPELNITLEEVYLNILRSGLPFQKVFRNSLFEEIEIDCFIPRFKVESSIELNSVLKALGVIDMFDPRLARLTVMARNELHVSKVIHRAELEVTEDGTPAASSNVPVVNVLGTFEANRPFIYLVAETVTNTILLSGIYQQPFLY